MPTHCLEMEICDTKQIYLRSIPKGWQPLKFDTKATCLNTKQVWYSDIHCTLRVLLNLRHLCINIGQIKVTLNLIVKNLTK